jgi:hypothetical protein
MAGHWADIRGDLDYLAWRDSVVAGLGDAAEAKRAAAIFSHFVAINAAVSAVTGEARVLTFQPDHAGISVFEAVGGRLTLVERGPEASTQVL